MPTASSMGSIWLAGGTSSAPRASRDADGDGDSDGNDFLVWQRQLGATAVVGGETAIPERSAGLLFVVGAVSIARGARRRT